MNKSLQRWMQKNGYSNRTLADKMNFSYEYIYKLANGKAEITDAFKWRFAEVFGFEQAIVTFGDEMNMVDTTR